MYVEAFRWRSPRGIIILRYNILVIHWNFWQVSLDTERNSNEYVLAVSITQTKDQHKCAEFGLIASVNKVSKIATWKTESLALNKVGQLTIRPTSTGHRKPKRFVCDYRTRLFPLPDLDVLARVDGDKEW